MPDPDVPPTSGPSSSAPESLAARRAVLHRWARGLSFLMDEALPIPLTKHRIGIDALLGMLLPGVGDAASSVSGVLLILFAFMMRVPGVVILRMAINTVFDTVTGVIPFVGDIFDIGFKSNRRNLELIERFQRPEARAKPSDYFFVALAVFLVAGALVVPLVLAAWVIARVLRG